VRTGVVLPTFATSAAGALEVAERAEAAGVDGVFCFDHIWPLGQPQRPALAPFPVLAAVAVSTERLRIGTLVARVGLVPEDVLVGQFDALAALAPGRVVAGLGTGDRLSAPENEAYGVAYAPAGERLASLRRCARALLDRGIEVWVGAGAGHPPTVAVAEEEGVAVNLWDAGVDRVASQARRSEVTWGGPAPRDPGSSSASEKATGGLVADLARTGASWAVFAWPAPLEVLAAAGRASTHGEQG
jgi:alkanesulfonate monooxygenase SsuD/methylene tetrahydromethanopterin reductase-like flavin-dependent oxidoreductase (luciferase family)